MSIKEKSPHSCRHTFSRLCESYGVREADRKRMLGYSFGNDITNGVYGHRTLEELRSEIEKIKLQETMGAPMARDFLADTGMAEEQIERVAYLVGHHHTLDSIDGLDYQILIEADFIVNACEKGWGGEKVKYFRDTVMTTAAGKRIVEAVFGV